MTSFVCWIPGKPTPQGSKKSFVINGRAILVDASGGNKAWRKLVTETIRAHKDYIILPGAINVSLAFFMEKAKSNKKEFMTQAPDVDKLARSVLDGITDSEIIEDDSRVIYLTASKKWAEPGQSGVLISIWQELPNA
jgi:Holliday junction resolvase RusA-like endonuclease